MACCPPGSWPELKKDPEYKDKGTVDVVRPLENPKLQSMSLYFLRLEIFPFTAVAALQNASFGITMSLALTAGEPDSLSIN